MKVSNYTDLAKYLAKEKEIKVSSHYGNDYDPNWIYIPRVYHNNYAKAKIRVLTDRDNVKNCLKITWNPERYTKADISRLITSNIPVLKRQLHGTCQNSLRGSELLQVLTGVLGRNGLPTPEAKSKINVELTK